jgi:hypothetical protein
LSPSTSALQSSLLSVVLGCVPAGVLPVVLLLLCVPLLTCVRLLSLRLEAVAPSLLVLGG